MSRNLCSQSQCCDNPKLIKTNLYATNFGQNNFHKAAQKYPKTRLQNSTNISLQIISISLKKQAAKFKYA